MAANAAFTCHGAVDLANQTNIDVNAFCAFGLLRWNCYLCASGGVVSSGNNSSVTSCLSAVWRAARGFDWLPVSASALPTEIVLLRRSRPVGFLGASLRDQ